MSCSMVITCKEAQVSCLQAPVAFGLATYLLSAKWAPQRARQALLVFASASPVVAALTYMAIMAAPGLSSQVTHHDTSPSAG